MNNPRVPGNSQRPTGRTAAATSLLELMLSGADAARDWARPIELPADRDRSLADMISRSGSVSALARDLHVSRSTVQRWRSGASTPGTTSRTKITEYNRAADRAARADVASHELGELINRYGGVKNLAQQIGANPSTIHRWLSGDTRSISPQYQQRLARADRQYRVQQTYGLSLGAGGRPKTPVYMHAKGDVGVYSASSPPYEYAKNFGYHTPGYPGHPLGDEVVADLFSAASDGDAFAALDILQADLSINYAQVPEGYDPAEGFGLYFGTVDEFELFQEDLDDDLP